VLAAAREHPTVSDIASALHLSPGTVRNYLSAAIGKTGARNRVEAIRAAEERGLALTAGVYHPGTASPPLEGDR
jgi:two-component system response regulator DesR